MKVYLFVLLFWVAASQGYFLQWFYENTDCTGSPYNLHINTTTESSCVIAGSNGYIKTFCNGDSISIKAGCPSCAATESQCTLNRPDTCFTRQALNSDNQPIQVGIKFTCQRSLPDTSIKQTYSGALLVADGYGASSACSGVAPIHNYYFKGSQCFQATVSSSFKVSCAGGAYSVTQHTGINCRGSGGNWAQAQCDESFTFDPSGPNTLQTLDCSAGSPTPSIGTIGSYLGGTTNPATTGPGAAGSATTTVANTNTNTNGGQPDSTVAGPAAASTAGQNSQTTGPGGNGQTSASTQTSSGVNNVGSNTGTQSVTTGGGQTAQPAGTNGPVDSGTNTVATTGATGSGPETATVGATTRAGSGTTNSPTGSGTTSGPGNNAIGSGVSSGSVLEVSALVIICGAVVSSIWIM